MRIGLGSPAFPGYYRSHRGEASSKYALAIGIASCFGPPAVTPTQTLSIDKTTSGPRSRGAYAVVFAGPRGTVENRAEPGVTVLFNRTMRSLDDDGHVPALSLHTDEGASVAGSWRWIGTHGVLFTPDGELPGATHFKVSVPAGTASLEGDKLATDYTFTFTTPRPKLLASTPYEGSATLEARGHAPRRLQPAHRTRRAVEVRAPPRANGRRRPRQEDPRSPWRARRPAPTRSVPCS